jgi:hypothetical protein
MELHITESHLVKTELNIMDDLFLKVRLKAKRMNVNDDGLFL